MPTTKHRINISVSPALSRALSSVAKRDHLPTATKAMRLIELALELEEDVALEAITRQRDTTKTTFLSHDEVWK